jgi:hypothetical protein
MVEEYFLKREPPRGTLLFEYQVVSSGPGRSGRWIDGVILLGEPTDIDHHIVRPGDGVPHPLLDGRNVIVVQAKRRFGMSLMGQALFSMKLMEQERGAHVVRSIALYGFGYDSNLESLMVQIDGRLGCEKGNWPTEPSAAS